MNWISIKDRMPQKHKWVLIIYDCCGEADVDIMRRVPWEGQENSFAGHRGYLTGDVTHWMPLPEAPDCPPYSEYKKDNPDAD